MKRVIRASKYSDEIMHNEDYIGKYAAILVDVVNSTDAESLASALSGAGRWLNNISSKPEAIQAIVQILDHATSEYLSYADAEASLPEVKKLVVDFLKGLGYDMSPISNTGSGIDFAYRLLPVHEADSQDLKEAASAVAKNFGIKPDTGVIGGSWTSYQFTLDGVNFRVGFERDYDEDPNGKSLSLQLTF